MIAPTAQRKETGDHIHLQAMILAAGFGSRLQPLTRYVPKPAFPVCNVPLIHFTLAELQKNGLRKVIINLHHLPQLVSQTVASFPGKMETIFSYEHEILGTGGAVKNVQSHLSSETLLLMNGDILFSGPWRDILPEHRANKALATLILRHDPLAAHFGRVVINAEKQIITIPPSQKAPSSAADSGMFTGVHLIEPELLHYFPAKSNFCIVRDVYHPLVEQGAPIYGTFVDRYWSDIGTPPRYLQANFDIMSLGGRLLSLPGEPEKDPLKQTLIAESAFIEPGCDIRNFVIIGPHCHLEQGSTVENAVLFPYVHLSKNQTLRNAIAHPEVIVPVAESTR
ncbi:sugar phosphate nucleotidyltransferase [candidate division CSSED10-310 bacterium]|uniref:Sugar phosphate nucleotidyltransferase n=1 Tax=candidate division CSSED10-310 bacterium TaxID=2855610 RepID=A0ABV6Z1L8_UNCC1